MIRPGTRMLALAVLGVGILLCILGGAAQRLPGDIGTMSPDRTAGYVAWAAVAGVLFAGAAALVAWRPAGPSRGPLVAVLLLGAAMRLVTFLPPPLLSTDVYRYVWDGRVQAAGINPYLHLPAARELEPLRDGGAGPAAIYSNINRAYYAPTIYPPAAQALFAAAAWAWPGMWGMKATMLAFDTAAAGVALLLLRAARLPLERVLIYAWNPLVAWEFAGAAHIDAAAAGLSALAVLAAVRCRPALAGGALGLAVLCKLLPLALLPALWRRWDMRTPLAYGAVVAAAYGAYALGDWGAGWRVLGYLPGYAAEEGLASGGGVFVLRLLAGLGPLPRWAGPAYAGLCLLGLVLLALWVVRRPLPADAANRACVISRDALWLGTATMAALSPHYPWYLTALALPAVLAPAPAALWLMLSAPVLYLDPDYDRIVWPALVFLPAAGLLAAGALRRVRLPWFHPSEGGL